MFKILILKSLYNLSDDKAEEQIRDRLSFRDFLGLMFADKVPDEAPNPNEPYYGDAGYVGAEREKRLRERGYNPQICERIPKSRPLLISEVKENNRTKSKIRCRIEHVFGEMKMRMGDETLRTIGFARARFWIGMRNLCYNMSRLVSLNKLKKSK